ncbi:MAG: TniQ family protein [Mesorhizobium sp.]
MGRNMPRVVLPLSPLQQPHEPAHAILASAADLNVPGAAKFFRRLMDNPQGHLVTNVSPDDVARFCSVDVKMLRHASPRFQGQMVTLMGERFRASDYSTRHRRWCPECLLETGSHRTWWDLTYVTSCPRHLTALSESCACGLRPTWGNSTSLAHCRCGRELSSSPKEALAPSDVAFDDYLVGRMTGEKSRSVRWLDSMEMHEVIDTVRALGRFVLDPFSETVFSHRQEDRRRLVSAGFLAALDLPGAVEAALERIDAEMGHMLTAPHFMHSDEFRCWLLADPDSGIKSVVRRVIRRWTEASTAEMPDSLPYGYFTLVHAAEVCDFSIFGIRAVLESYRKIPRRPFYANVDPVTLAWLRHHVGNRMNTKQIAEELDITVREIFPLRQEGYIKPFVEAAGTMSLFFSPDEPKRLMNLIASRCLAENGIAENTHPLPAASRSIGVPVSGLVSSIMDGKLRLAGVSRDGVGLSKFLVVTREAASLGLPGWADIRT